MPETPEELHARVADALRMPPLEEWETFPFDGAMRPRPLAPPAEVDTPRRGEGGVDCDRCGGSDDDFFWTNERWRLRALGPTGMPFIALLEPREHYAEPGELPEELLSELGLLIGRIERSIRELGNIGRVHVCRYGDGGEHLHWWFIARPTRLPQLVGSFIAIWDDVLPPVPEEIWREDVARVAAALA